MGCMHDYSYACVFITIVASMSLIGFGMLTSHWMTSETQNKFKLNFPVLGGIFTVYFDTNVNVDVKMALTKACFEATLNGDLNLENIPSFWHSMAQSAADSYMGGKPKTVTLKNCMDKETKFKGPDALKIKHSLRHFKHIFISLLLGMVLLLASFVIELVKSPCSTRRYRSRKFHLAAIILLLSSTIPLFTGMYLLYQRDFTMFIYILIIFFFTK